MSNSIHHDTGFDKLETSSISKYQPIEFPLTIDQFTIIQHYLPRGYVLQ
jgi:hypothetical protein